VTPTVPQIVQLLLERKFEEARAAILRLTVEDPQTTRTRGVTLANWLASCAGWGTVSSLVPPGTNSLAETGWLNSLLRGEPVNSTDKPIPWFTYPAIDFLDRIPAQALSVFEWGSGNSTLWWAARARAVLAVESNEAWYNRIRERLPSQAVVHLRKEKPGYVDMLANSGTTFDVIVIDGDHRNECAAQAVAHANPDGLIVLDNSDRRAYAPAVEVLSAAGWRRIDFFGLIPSYVYRTCTSVFFKNDSYLRPALPPSEPSPSLGPSCAQAMRE
jgi:hypothetical protein